MKDPTGIMVMAEGGEDAASGEQELARISIEIAKDGGAVVRVSRRPLGGGAMGPMGEDEEMKPFETAASAAEFVTTLLAGNEMAEVEEELEVPIEEEVIDASMGEDLMGASPDGPVEFAGQRSYRG